MLSDDEIDKIRKWVQGPPSELCPGVQRSMGKLLEHLDELDRESIPAVRLRYYRALRAIEELHGTPQEFGAEAYWIAREALTGHRGDTLLHD